MIRGRAAMSVPSTDVNVPASPWSLGSRPAIPPGGAGNCPLSSWMISTSRWGSKIVAASESDPSAARAQPSFFWTFASSLACCRARSDEQIGLNR